MLKLNGTTTFLTGQGVQYWIPRKRLFLDKTVFSEKKNSLFREDVKIVPTPIFPEMTISKIAFSGEKTVFSGPRKRLLFWNQFFFKDLNRFTTDIEIRFKSISVFCRNRLSGALYSDVATWNRILHRNLMLYFNVRDN